jgi:hypothetical protein
MPHSSGPWGSLALAPIPSDSGHDALTPQAGDHRDVKSTISPTMSPTDEPMPRATGDCGTFGPVSKTVMGFQSMGGSNPPLSV